MKKTKTWFIVIGLCVSVIAGFALTDLIHSRHEMDKLVGRWYRTLADADEYLTLCSDMTYTLHRNLYSSGEVSQTAHSGTFQIDGNTISIDIPQGGTVTVYKVSFSDGGDTMTWTERYPNGETDKTEYHRIKN